MKNNRKNKTGRKNKAWLQNPDQIKTAKLYSFQAIRLPSGQFHLIGGQNRVAMRINQHKVEWVNVDTRDLACELRNSKITSL